MLRRMRLYLLTRHANRFRMVANHAMQISCQEIATFASCNLQAELRRRAVVMVDDGKTRQQRAADAVGVSRRFRWQMGDGA